jgi:predicted Zn-dependent protease
MSFDAAPPAAFDARHFDGLTPESRPVRARVAPDGVWLEDEAGARRWELAELVLVRGDARGEPVQLERRSDPVEVLIVPDRAFLAALRAALPAGARLTKRGAWTPPARAVAGLVLAAVALILVIYRFAIPALADFAADHVPAAWERSYGEAVLAELAPEQDRVAEPAVRRPAETIHRLLAARAGERASDTRIVVLRSSIANAFAVPGGNVVVTTGLLRTLESPDELAAVIAHEHGHIRRGHVMRAIMRRLSLGVLLGLVAGDHSALSGGLRAAGELGALSYSREHEREADDEAIVLLERCGASPLALADALDHIGRAAPSGVVPGFLSTHPAPAARRLHIRAAAASFAAPAAAPAWRSNVGWQEMKAALASDAGDATRPGAAAEGHP